MEEDYLRIEGFNTLTAGILDVKTFWRQYKNIDHPYHTQKYTPVQTVIIFVQILFLRYLLNFNNLN